MSCITFDYDPDPNASNTADQVLFNTELKADTRKLNQYALSRRNSYWTSSRETPPATTYYITALKNANQFVGIISAASPGAIANLYLPAIADMNFMDSFFIQDESINAATYNITIKTQGSAKIYGAGLSASGVTSVTISDDGGYKELIYVTTNKFYLIRKSA